MDVFQFHDGVINESADAEGKSSEREDVQRLSGEIERDKGDEHGERNGDGDDDGARQVAQKDEDHCCGQERAVKGLLDEIADGLAYIEGLVERNAEIHSIGNSKYFGHGCTESIDDFDRVGDGLFVHTKEHGSVSVCMDDIGLDVGRIGHGPHIAHPDWVALRIHLDDDVLDGLHRAELIIGEDVVVEIAGFDVAGGENDV